MGVRVCKATSWENKKGTDEKVESLEVFAPIVINAAGMTYCKIYFIKKSIKFFFIILKNDIKIRAEWKLGGHYNDLDDNRNMYPEYPGSPMYPYPEHDFP